MDTHRNCSVLVSHFPNPTKIVKNKVVQLKSSLANKTVRFKCIEFQGRTAVGVFGKTAVVAIIQKYCKRTWTGVQVKVQFFCFIPVFANTAVSPFKVKVLVPPKDLLLRLYFNCTISICIGLEE